MLDRLELEFYEAAAYTLPLSGRLYSVHHCFLSDCSLRVRYGKKLRKIDPLCDYLVKHAK